MLRRLLIVSALGLVLAVAIAWAQARLWPQNGSAWKLFRLSTGAEVRAEIPSADEAAISGFIQAQGASGASITQIMDDRHIPWPYRGKCWPVESYGWPFRGLCTIYGGGGMVVDFGVNLGDVRTDLNTGERMRRALPLAPSPLFGLDWLFWSAVLLLGWNGLMHARARWRYAKGRCTRCGYPSMGIPATTPCPECGSVVQRSVPE